jgi:diacylglycerol kinase (ATP)
MNLLLIINPVSGTQTVNRQLVDVISDFECGGYKVTSMCTGKRGDAALYAEKYSGRYDRVVCVGGDGTLHEVINGLMKAHLSVPLGYIPCGSTNDFAATHGLSLDPRKADDAIIHGTPKPIDIGKIDNRYFAYSAAFGYFSGASYETPQSMKNILGHAAYILNAVKYIRNLRSENLQVTADDRIYTGHFIFGAVCSTLSIAGVLKMPDGLTDVTDGKFEVILVRKPPLIFDVSTIARDLLAQRYDSNPYITLFQTDSLEIVSERRKIDWSLDGEHFVSGSTVTLQCCSKSINLVH